MTIRRHIAIWLSWWHRAHPSRNLEHALPDYAIAVRHERLAKARNDMKALHRAREAKRAALHSNMAGMR